MKNLIHLLPYLTLIFLISCSNVLGEKTSLEDESSDNTPVAIAIVSAPSGAGSEITTSTLNDNTTLTLYAVSVNSDGDYVEDVSVTWAVTNDLGTLSTSSGTSTTFTPTEGAGSEVITATHADLGSDTTGTLSVTYTVTSISNLEAWFKADAGVTYNGSDEVSDWQDFSTNSNDATQSSTTLKPLFVASAINGQPAVRFDGSNDKMETGATIVNGTSARTIFIVATNISNTGTYNVLMDLTDTVTTSGTNYAITTEVAVRISGNRVFNEGIGVGETKVLTVTNAASTTSSGIEAYLDGVQATQASVSSQTINTLSNPVRIGEAAFGASNCNCDIAEIVVYSSLLGTTDRQSVEAYLKNKYGL